MAIKNKTDALKMEDILKKSKKLDSENIKESEVISGKNVAKNKSKTKKKAEKIEVPKGRPKNGHVWRNEKTRFSSIIKTKGIRISFEKKQALRQELKRIKEASRAIIASRKEEKEQKKQRRRENLERQAENKKKSEIVQVIRNTSKIKKMKKKHLRSIEKRDTTNM